MLAKAIAMSLEQNVQKKEGPTQSNATSNNPGVLSPIRREELTDFAEELLNSLLTVIPHVADTVYRSRDLLVALIKRNGAEWRDKAIHAVKEKVLQ